MREQLDLFGNSTPVKEVLAKEKRTMKRLFRKLYGFDHNHVCKDCESFVSVYHRGKHYYKCKHIGLSNSEATDIHLKDTACKLWAERKEE